MKLMKNICTCVIGGPICGTCLGTHLTTKDPKTMGNNCKSCGGFWKDCPVCAKVKLRRKNADAAKTFAKELKELQAKNKEQELKLYEVKISGHREHMVYKVGVVVILAKDELEARVLALEDQVGSMNLSDKIQIEAREITGPFKAGSILSKRSEK